MSKIVTRWSILKRTPLSESGNTGDALVLSTMITWRQRLFRCYPRPLQVGAVAAVVVRWVVGPLVAGVK